MLVLVSAIIPARILELERSGSALEPQHPTSCAPHVHLGSETRCWYKLLCRPTFRESRRSPKRDKKEATLRISNDRSSFLCRHINGTIGQIARKLIQTAQKAQTWKQTEQTAQIWTHSAQTTKTAQSSTSFILGNRLNGTNGTNGTNIDTNGTNSIIGTNGTHVTNMDANGTNGTNGTNSSTIWIHTSQVAQVAEKVL